VFLGTHRPRLDEKGRLALPAKFRDELAGGVVVTKGQDRCLFIWPAAEFAEVAAQLSTASSNRETVRRYSRTFFASASDEVPDRQGRITVPPVLRSYAGLDRDCVVLGANNRVEVWDATAWDEYSAESDDSFAAQSEEILPGVF
jgi:MraZ protein